jgi:hypothetical protein
MGAGGGDWPEISLGMYVCKLVGLLVSGFLVLCP